MATVGAKNQPIVQTTDTFNPVNDINTLSNWVANNYASFKILTGATTRTSVTGADLFTGLVVWEQSTGQFWQYNGTAWLMLGIGSAPRAELSKTSIQTFSVSGTNYDVTGWTSIETRGITANTTTGVITVVQPGRYNISAQITYASNATGARYATIFRNGSIVARTVASSVGAATHFQQVTVTGITLAASDTLVLSANQTSGGSLATTASGNYFNVEYVGA